MTYIGSGEYLKGVCAAGWEAMWQLLGSLALSGGRELAKAVGETFSYLYSVCKTLSLVQIISE